ncbi:hypothetical protein BBta_2638 [Bradyrhizobium sp. BTAi1]|nr:hypothetical protein BBta_2638 [Bradyrhizobium sp. BTAi1]
MAKIIPGQSGHAIAHFHLEMLDHMRHLPSAPVTISVIVAMKRAIRLSRDDLVTTEVTVRVLDDTRDQQRITHHLADERTLSIVGHGFHFDFPIKQGSFVPIFRVATLSAASRQIEMRRRARRSVQQNRGLRFSVPARIASI